MNDVLERSGGKVRLWPATLYGSLKRLIEDGLISESGERPAPEFDDARRRYYRLTSLGQQVLDLESQRLQDLVRVLNSRQDGRHTHEYLGGPVQCGVPAGGTGVSPRVSDGLR